MAMSRGAACVTAGGAVVTGLPGAVWPDAAGGCGAGPCSAEGMISVISSGGGGGYSRRMTVGQPINISIESKIAITTLFRSINSIQAKGIAYPHLNKPILFHRVIAARMKWVTAQNPPRSHVDAAQCPILCYRFDRVLRTGGREPA